MLMGSWRQTRCSSLKAWMNIKGDMPTMIYYAAIRSYKRIAHKVTQLDLNIGLSEKGSRRSIAKYFVNLKHNIQSNTVYLSRRITYPVTFTEYIGEKLEWA